MSKRIPANASPMQRTLALLRSRGCTVATTEHWNSHAKCKQDLFGWIDVVATGCGRIVGVQTTTASNLAARIRKAKALPAYSEWIGAGGVAVFHGWKKPSKANPLWTLVEKVNP